MELITFSDHGDVEGSGLWEEEPCLGVFTSGIPLIR